VTTESGLRQVQASICELFSKAALTLGRSGRDCSIVWKRISTPALQMLQNSRGAKAGRPKIMAKGQKRSNKEVRKPKAKVPKKTNASQLSKKTMGIRTA